MASLVNVDSKEEEEDIPPLEGLSIAPSFREPSGINVLGTGGRMLCRSCQSPQPFSNHTCDNCGCDPWADSQTAAPLPLAPSSTVAAAEPPATSGAPNESLPLPPALPSAPASGIVSSSSDRPVPNYAAVAEQHAECSICFEPLCSNPTSVLILEDRRVCRHFFHSDCCEGLLNADHIECPLCRAEFDEFLDVPNIDEKPDEWFAACDQDGDGSLNTREVFEIIKAQFPIDYKKLEKDLPMHWKKWDPNMDGQIEKHEFLGPKGLLSFMRKNFVRMEERLPPPVISSENKLAWFDYFDEDNNGDLSQEEVVRGLIKSFNIGNNSEKVADIKRTIQSVWFVYDHDGDGEISRDEFTADGSLADSIIAEQEKIAQVPEEAAAEPRQTTV